MITKNIVSTHLWVNVKYNHILYIIPKIRMIFNILLDTTFSNLELMCKVEGKRSPNQKPTTLHTNKNELIV